MSPVGLSVNPGVMTPLVTVKVTGGVALKTGTCWLKGTPTVPEKVPPTLIGGDAKMLME